MDLMECGLGHLSGGSKECGALGQSVRTTANMEGRGRHRPSCLLPLILIDLISKAALRPLPSAHIHDCINLGNSLIIRGKLVDLDPIADQLTHDLDLELVELTLGDGVSFGNDGNNVHLPGPWRGVRGELLPDCG